MATKIVVPSASFARIKAREIFLAAINNFPADTPLAYIVNSLISRLINCEGANGPSGAGGISFTEHTLPSGGGSLP